MEKECTTPKKQEYKIPPALVCPPPPMKKKQQQREKTEIEYFRSTEVDMFFAAAARGSGTKA